MVLALSPAERQPGRYILAGRAFDCIISALMFCGIEQENAKLVLN